MPFLGTLSGIGSEIGRISEAYRERQKQQALAFQQALEQRRVDLEEKQLNWRMQFPPYSGSKRATPQEETARAETLARYTYGPRWDTMPEGQKTMAREKLLHMVAPATIQKLWLKNPDGTFHEAIGDPISGAIVSEFPGAINTAALPVDALTFMKRTEADGSESLVPVITTHQKAAPGALQLSVQPGVAPQSPAATPAAPATQPSNRDAEAGDIASAIAERGDANWWRKITDPDERAAIQQAAQRRGLQLPPIPVEAQSKLPVASSPLAQQSPMLAAAQAPQTPRTMSERVGQPIPFGKAPAKPGVPLMTPEEIDEAAHLISKGERTIQNYPAVDRPKIDLAMKHLGLKTPSKLSAAQSDIAGLEVLRRDLFFGEPPNTPNRVQGLAETVGVLDDWSSRVKLNAAWHFMQTQRTAGHSVWSRMTPDIINAYLTQGGVATLNDREMDYFNALVNVNEEIVALRQFTGKPRYTEALATRFQQELPAPMSVRNAKDAKDKLARLNRDITVARNYMLNAAVPDSPFLPPIGPAPPAGSSSAPTSKKPYGKGEVPD